MKLVQKYPVLGSSANSDNLSVTVQSFLMAILPVALILAKAYELPLTENDFLELIKAITGFLSAGMFLFGVGRKLYYTFKQ